MTKQKAKRYPTFPQLNKTFLISYSRRLMETKHNFKISFLIRIGIIFFFLLLLLNRSCLPNFLLEHRKELVYLELSDRIQFK
jgi:hypothetical protein